MHMQGRKIAERKRSALQIPRILTDGDLKELEKCFTKYYYINCTFMFKSAQKCVPFTTFQRSKDLSNK